MKTKPEDMNAVARAALKKLVLMAKPVAEVRIPASQILSGLTVKLPSKDTRMPQSVKPPREMDRSKTMLSAAKGKEGA